jgi:hypothetical protein
LLSGFISLLIAFHQWPSCCRFITLILVSAWCAIFFKSLLFKIFSLELDEFHSKVPKKSGFKNYTWTHLFTRQQIMFNIFLILLIIIGHVISSKYSP